MPMFNDRESAFENKFVHDAAVEFNIAARANKLLGLWAAELLGKSGEDADKYAVEVIISELKEAGHEDVIRKVHKDLSGIRPKMSKVVIGSKLASFASQAAQEITQG
ncbi:MAG: DUF1476 domain-containing protein [Rhodobacteraceae bacterium]|nr:DUF1476 domain-containing protein [Paracoccaceae bacterium]